MQNVQKGFTLIELVVVIVLLGILGVTALAKFQDLSGDAQTAVNAGIAAELSSGASINYAAKSLNSGNGFDLLNDSCADIATDVMASRPSGYTWTGSCGASAGVATTCYVQDTPLNGTSAAASVICI